MGLKPFVGICIGILLLATVFGLCRADKPVSASSPYLQATASLFQYAGQPPLANWTVLSSVLRIEQAVALPSSASKHEEHVAEFLVLAMMSSDKKWRIVQLDAIAPPKKANTSRPTYAFHPFSASGIHHVLSPSWRLAFAQQVLFVAGPDGLYRCASIKDSCEFATAEPSMGKVGDLAAGADGDLWIAAANGLYYYPGYPGGISRVNISEGGLEPFTSVAFHTASGVVAAGTPGFLWRFDGVATWRFYRVPGIIDGPISSLSFEADGTLWIGNDVCVNRMHPNTTLERVAGLPVRGNQGGLPFSNITAVAASSARPGSVWFGALQGAAQYFPRDLDDAVDRTRPSDWRYLYGPRWMPVSPKSFAQRGEDNRIVSLAPGWFLDGVKIYEMALIVTPVGLSAVWFQPWTLQMKADYFQAMMSPRHNRFGLVGDCRLKEFGKLDTWQPEANDNNGLWTSMYVASQAFRYSVTKDPAVKADAWHYFKGLEFLNNVTGIKGLMARSVLHQTQTPSSGTWYNSSVYPGWIWKGDTSSDEVTGHLFVYPLVYDLLAETKEEKMHPHRLIYDITKYIVENGYLLIDVTGKPTTWGRWSPEYLNNNQSWYDERGLNSMQMLGFLLSAYRVTGDRLFMDSFSSLVDTYQYGQNIINAKITQTSDDNYSDDELLFLPYFTYVWSGMTSLQHDFVLSITREWRIVEAEHSSLWNFIAGVSGIKEYRREGAVWNLRNWPLSWIDWPTDNTQRLDIISDPNAKRNGERDQSVELIPYDEQDFFRWNSNMFSMKGGSGFDETDMGAWLLPYWMGRYYGYIKP